MAYFIGYLKAQSPGYHPLQLTNISSLQNKLKTGDLIFTKALRFIPRLQQYFLGSYVNHVAMIYKTPDDELWVWDTNPSVGAYMTRLETFLSDNFHGRAARPLDPPLGLHVPYINPKLPTNTQDQKSNIFIRRLYNKINEKKILQFLQQNEQIERLGIVFETASPYIFLNNEPLFDTTNRQFLIDIIL